MTAALSVLVGCGASAATITESATVTTSDEGCAPVAILAYRGSTNSNIDATVVSPEGRSHQYPGSDLMTSGWEGQVLERLFRSFAVQRYGDGFRPDRVPVIAVGPASVGAKGYPAIHPGAPTRELMGSIDGGLAAGAEAIQRITNSQPASCAATPKFIAVGFSQGAIVARLLAQLNPVAVIGVVSVGDPLQKPDAPGNEGSGASCNGIVRWSFPLFQDKLDSFYSLTAHKSALCHKGDPFCDFQGRDSLWTLLDPVEHFSYMTGLFTSEAAVKGKEVADLARELYRDSLDRAESGRAPRSLETWRIGVSTFATVGIPTTVAVASTNFDRSRRFDFDLDGDGVFETPSASGVVEATFIRSGAATVSVRVTDAQSKQVVVSDTIDIAPVEALNSRFNEL